jgi:hypothetical protein
MQGLKCIILYIRKVDPTDDTEKLCSVQKKQSSPATHHGGAWGERRYSSYSFLTSALDRGEWSVSRPCRALPRGTCSVQIPQIS